MKTDIQNLQRFVDHDVVDKNNKKIGTLTCLWADQKGQPAFLGVKTGWFSGKHHIVPAYAAELNEAGRKIRVPLSEDVIKDAPTVDPDMNVDEGSVRKIYDYYKIKGVTFEDTGAVFRKQQMSREQEDLGGRETTAREKEFRTEAPPRQVTPTPQAPSPMEETLISLTEERLKVGKRQVESGGVRLRKVIRTETVNQPVELQHEEIVIERMPFREGQSTAAVEKAFEEQEIFIPLRHEEAVIEKERFITEEVHARKKTETERQTVSERVRKEDLQVVEVQGEQGGREEKRTTPLSGRL